MANKVIYTSRFARDAKPFIKKHPSFRNTLELLEQELLANPRLGKPYGNKIYKIRLADESKGKGKSGGFRVITYVISEDDTTVFMITIFDKSEEDNIQKQALLQLIKKLGL